MSIMLTARAQIRKVNSHAIRVEGPDTEYGSHQHIILPACNIGLNQRAEDPDSPWDTYFECSARIGQAIMHMQFSYNEPEDYWEMSVWDSRTRCRTTQTTNVIRLVQAPYALFFALAQINRDGIWLATPGKVFDEVFVQHGTRTSCPVEHPPIPVAELNRLTMKYGRV